MRKYLGMLLALILAFALVSAVLAESEQINPEEILNWEVIKITPAPQPGFLWMFLRNPNYYSEIKIVAALANIKFYLFGYRYFRGVSPYEFKLNPETGEYIGGLLSGEERKSCVRCHRAKLGLEA